MAMKYPWWQPEMGELEKKLILQVLAENYPNEGAYAKEFENMIAKKMKVKHAIAVTSGTAAMFLSLKALGVGHGDEVIVPDLTFVATANAADMCGATPVLVDIDPGTITIDPEAIEKAITSRTKAIMPVHVTGRPANMKRIAEIAKVHDLVIVEDAAEAFMSKYQGKCLGTFGDAGCFSFSPNKVITTGQGGMIVTNSDKVQARLRELKDQGRPARGTGGNDIHYSRGYNFKFTNLQAAMGLGQMECLDFRMNRLKRHFEIYQEGLSGLEGLRVLPFNLKDGELPLWTDVLVDDRNEMVDFLLRHDIDCRKFWLPIHSQRAYQADGNIVPCSSRYSPQALWLPSAFTLKDEDILFVSEKIKEFFNRG